MKKIYIAPSSKYLMVRSEYVVLQEYSTGGPSVQADTLDGNAKERDFSYSSTTDVENTSGNFGSDNGPWESLW